MANSIERILGCALWALTLSLCAVGVCGEVMQSTTCSLTTEQRRVFPRGLLVDNDYCAMNVTVTVNRIGMSNFSCALVVEPFVTASRLPFDKDLKNFTVVNNTEKDVIGGCIVVKSKHNNQTIESVVGEQVIPLNIEFSRDNYPEDTCRWKDACRSTVSISVDRPPVITAEVNSQGVDETKQLGMCCGDCDGNGNESDVSSVTVNVTASDVDWQWVEARADTFRMQHWVKLRVVNSSGDLTDSQLDARQLTDLTELWTDGQKSTEVIRRLTRQSVCDWLKQSAELVKVSMGELDVVLEMVVNASVQTGVDANYLLSDSTMWSGLIRVQYRNKCVSAVMGLGAFVALLAIVLFGVVVYIE